MNKDITFDEASTGLRVNYKGIYKGRIILVDGKYEYQEKNYSRYQYMYDPPKFNSIEKAKKDTAALLGIQMSFRKEYSIDGLTSKGKKFLLKFGDKPVLRKTLSKEELKIANMFVDRGVLEKSVVGKKYSPIVYHLPDDVRLQIQDYIP